MDRKEAVNKLSKGDIKVVFSVDMFTEGLDIPSVDFVMFLIFSSYYKIGIYSSATIILIIASPYLSTFFSPNPLIFRSSSLVLGLASTKESS